MCFVFFIFNRIFFSLCILYGSVVRAAAAAVVVVFRAWMFANKLSSPFIDGRADGEHNFHTPLFHTSTPLHKYQNTFSNNNNIDQLFFFSTYKMHASHTNIPIYSKYTYGCYFVFKTFGVFGCDWKALDRIRCCICVFEFSCGFFRLVLLLFMWLFSWTRTANSIGD